MLRMGILGCGYWGPNVVRNFYASPGVRIAAVCDMQAERAQAIGAQYPGVNVIDDWNDLVSSPDIDAVAVVTPVSTHYPLARAALDHHKHIFVTKPFTATSAEAEDLVARAEKKGLVVMVDHTFLFTGAVRRVKQLVDEGALGDLLYYDSTRVNLGLFQHDVNVIWDLAPHDFSILDFIFQRKPVVMTAQGMDHFDRGHVDVAYVTAYFDGKMIAHFNVNWLSPVKLRTTLVGGRKKMLVWDDLQADEKIRVYDKGVDVNTEAGANLLKVAYRAGDAWIPKIEHGEALRREADYFVECVTHGKRPFNDGASGVRVVRMLECANESLVNHGREVKV